VKAELRVEVPPLLAGVEEDGDLSRTLKSGLHQRAAEALPSPDGDDAQVPNAGRSAGETVEEDCASQRTVRRVDGEAFSFGQKKLPLPRLPRPAQGT
jgi:hypothetical protein